MDLKQLVPLAMALLTAGGAGIGWQGAVLDFDRAAAKYRAAKDLGRACMGDEAFDDAWADVLADLREAEGRGE